MEIQMTKNVKTFSEKRKKAAKQRQKKLWAYLMIGLTVSGGVITMLTVFLQSKPMVAETKPKSEVVASDVEQNETLHAVLNGTYDQKKEEADKAEKEKLEAEAKAKQEEAEAKQEEAIQNRINEAVTNIETEANTKIQTANDNIKNLQTENDSLKQKVSDLQKENETLKKQVEAKK